MSVTGEPGGPPMKVGVPLTDLGAGLFALSAILAALHYRDRTGRGQHIDTSLVEAGLALSVWEAAQYFADGTVPQALGSAHRMLAPYQAIRCADGYITIGAGTDRLFQRLASLLGHRRMARRSGVSRRNACASATARLLAARDRNGDDCASRARIGWRCSSARASRAGRSTRMRRRLPIRSCGRAT